MINKKTQIAFYVLTVLLGASGSVVFLCAPRYSMLKTLGMALVALSAYLFKVSRDQRTPQDKSQVTGHPSTAAPSRSRGLVLLLRAMALVAVFAVALSYVFLRNDALEGGHQVWPAYAFTASIIFGAVVWSYLLAKSTFKK